MNTSRIVLVDLRDPDAEPPDVVAGGVVVIDHASALVEHAETYLSLLAEDMVTAVVCVAVGEASTENPLDGVVLSVPPALRHATVLWVGDTQGVDWAPERSVPRPVEQPGDALDSLVAALRVPTLFDQVVAVAEGLSSAAVNPGIRLVSSAADPVELAEARAAAVASLCAPEHSVPHDLGASIGRSYLPSSRDGAVLSGPVQTSRTEALRRLDQVAELARTLGTTKALLYSPRSTERLGSQVVWAGQAVENYRRAVAELLNRMDGHLQVGRPSFEEVVALGVPRPREVDGGEIAADLKQAVDARLDAGAALSALAQDLRLVAVNSGPQGCTAAVDEVQRRGPLSLEMPRFRTWPLPLVTLPLIFVACALLTLLIGSGWLGWVAGGLLAAGWFGSGWLLLARRPGPEAECGLEAALPPAVITYGVAGVLGTVFGIVVGQMFAVQLAGWLVDVPPWVTPVAAVLTVLLSAAVVVLSWRSAVQDWRGRLRVAQLRAAVGDLTRTAEEVTAREWLPMQRRRALAAAAAEVAGGLEEIATTLGDAGNRLFVALEVSAGDHARMVRPVPQELYAVVRSDLVDVCRSALEPAWPAAAAVMPTPQGLYAQRLDRLLAEYGGDVRRNGLMTATRFSHDPGPRDALMGRVWSESPVALAALRSDGSSDMTQLCRSGQLGYLSTVTEPGLVRFAPARLRQVLERDGAHKALVADPGVVWSEGGDFVGTVRLLPLRPESVRQVLGGVR
ncbi:hypothetical protein ALI22I_28740 [Saccharothrix sp. ALI-22-I]|uniref:hypothetical protein n=1 Tax=Saccharothrix sp. ALI-22-I TaxID=1933778 RepID=UPI00097CA81F|nr:hypothetical protein [Saccharothrix sp. ALI-22-I]ONI84544.1 hypothetical protein ALI22I_28740 [Saccharothrix sp. ALI-22-I]